MNDSEGRVVRLEGTPREVGFAHGAMLRDVLADYIRRWVENGLGRLGLLDTAGLAREAMPLLGRLPGRFREEIEGMAEGAGLPLETLAEWFAADGFLKKGCTGFLCLIDGNAWVARNNDYWLPHMWGYTIVREIDGRIPTMTFGLRGDVFTATGVNAERLWLHFNWLDVDDQTGTGGPGLPCHVFVPEALETCRMVTEVERLLWETGRAGGMNLFVLDGKTDEFAVFECSRAKHVRRDPQGGCVAATNHAATAIEAGRAGAKTPSRIRLDRVESLLEEAPPSKAPEDLFRVLADGGVARETRAEEFGTVYSNVACPSLGLTWFAYGGLPAPSAGAWYSIPWPWPGVSGNG